MMKKPFGNNRFVLHTLIATGLLASTALLLFTNPPQPDDFAQFYQASKLAPKVNVYDYGQLAPHEQQLGMPGVAFLRPLWFTFFARPFTFFSFRTALFLWRILSLMASAGFV